MQLRGRINHRPGFVGLTKSPILLVLVILLGTFAGPLVAHAGDWPRFRGPNGSGTNPDGAATPVSWSATDNLKWKTALPGPGVSSPIVVGDRVFVTCWTGHGTPEAPDAPQRELRRHLICLDRTTGAIVWDKSVNPVLPEDEYGGMFAEHGYASHTPVSDGERVYAYFGKTGALAFNMDGQLLWQTSIGLESDPRGWGSAGSPILFGDILIINGAAESEALVGLDKHTGRQVWRQEASGLSGVWATPVLVPVSDERTDLVIGVPNEIWGINPLNGKLTWYCKGVSTDSVRASVVVRGDVVYFSEGRGGTVAVRAGGKGDVTETHVLWRSRDGGGIPSPLVHGDKLYLLGNRIARVLDANTGESVQQLRIPPAGGSASGERSSGDGPAGSGERPRGDEPGRGPGRPGGPPWGGGGFGRGPRAMEYSSPVLSGDYIYFTGRSGEVTVIRVGEQLEVVATNSLGSEGEDFSATPAISQGNLFIRSNKFVYCIGE